MDRSIEFGKLLDRYQHGNLSRRGFLGAVGTMALTAGVIGPAMGPLARAARAADTIRFDSYGGVFQTAVDNHMFKLFTEKTGTTVTQGSFGSPDDLLTKIRAEGMDKYNVFTASDESTLLRFIKAGYVEEIDESRIPRLKDIADMAVNSYRSLSDGKLMGVPSMLSGVWLGYNTEKVEKAEMDEKGFNILLDPKYKGQIAGEDYWMRRMYYGALQSGQNPNDIKDLDAVWDKIRESRELVLKYWKSGAEQMQLFSTGGIAVSDAWFVRVRALGKQGYPIEGYPKKGTYVTFACFAAVKGTPMDAFYEMIDILLRPEVQYPLAIEVGNAPLLNAQKFPPPPEVETIPGFDPTGTLEGYRTIDPLYWGVNADEWQRQYQRVMARG